MRIHAKIENERTIGVVAYRYYFWIGTLAGCAAALFLYYGTFFRLARDLFSTDGSYKLLIVLVGVWIIYHHRRQLRSLPVRPNIAGGAFLLTAGCFIYFSGEITSTLLVRDISLIFTTLGFILLLFGTARFKVLALPILYLILLYPLIERILGNFSYYFQIVAAKIATFLLRTVGIPVFLDKEFIQLPDITLEVARSCNGIHHAISLLALSIPVALFTQKTNSKRFFVVIFAFFAGIFLNGFRVALIGVWSRFTEGEFTHGPFDLFYTASIFVMGVLVIGVTSFLGRYKNSRGKQPNDRSEKQLSAAVAPAQKYRILPLVLAGVIFGVTIIYGATFKLTPVELRDGFGLFPQRIGGFSAKPVHDAGWPFEHLNADESFKRIYYNDRTGEGTGLYIGYYAVQTQEKEMINDLFNWLYIRAEVVEIASQSGPFKVNRSIYQTESGQKVYYFWHHVDKRIILHPFAVKFFTLIDSLFYRKNSGAMIVVSTDRSELPTNISDMEFLEAAVPVIEGYLRDNVGGRKR